MTPIDPLEELEALDRLAAEGAGDEIVETMTPTASPDLGDIVEAAGKKAAKKADKKATKAKAKVETKTEVKAKKEPKAPKKAAEAKAPKVKKEAVAKPAKEARPTREAARDVLGADTFDGIVASIATMPKKVADKAENVLDFVAGRRALSGYTRYAIDALLEEGKITSTGLVKMLEKRDYSPGTARAQAQQMMALLPQIGLASRDKAELTLIKKSPILKQYQKAAA